MCVCPQSAYDLPGRLEWKSTLVLQGLQGWEVNSCTAGWLPLRKDRLDCCPSLLTTAGEVTRYLNSGANIRPVRAQRNLTM